jgi:hypothetical protein
MRRYVILLAVMALAAGLLAVPAGAGEVPDRLDRALPASIDTMKLDSPITSGDVERPVLDVNLGGAVGDQRVIVRLKGDSLAEAGISGDAAQAKFVRGLSNQQSAFVDRIKALTNAVEIARTQRVLNAVFLEIDASQLDVLASDPDVVRVARVGDYQIDLSETVPYIGASAVHDLGFDGSGIKVAVLDSGIDYYHAALSGSGDPAEYAADDPTVIEPGTFPTDKVVGGYDFVGSTWDGTDAGGVEQPDPDPLDKGPGAGHGTHVADIIGGEIGVAPGVDLFAVKVCSSVSTACSGIALIEGMEFAVDPNMDGMVKDRVDLVNMSLGSLYGQPFDDDLSLAVDNATALGVLTVAAAGNSADKPYIVDTPSAAPTAFSVAQTQVPSAVLPFMEVTAPEDIAGLYSAVFQDWSVPLSVSGAVEGPLQYGNGVGSNLDGCAPFASGSLSGKVILVDRGACNFTLKISNISVAGGVAGIIGLIDNSDPFNGGDGGDRPIDIPGFMISKALADLLRSGLPDTYVVFDPANGVQLIGTMVGSSSRGPSNYYQAIKPEIGAPGASVSAIAGSGDGTGPFGGTSGATPMITGSAALLLDGYGGTKTTGKGTPNGNALGHGLDPLLVKALLMNNGDTDIYTDPFTPLAPITRIGGGEVRVDEALSAPAAAFSADDFAGALSFGFVDVTDTVTLTKTVTIRNLDNGKHTYNVTPTFRYASDEATGAVTFDAPSKVTVKPGLGKETTFDVSITIDASLLPGNYMNSGSEGANPDALTLNEFDGYLILDDGTHPIHMAWQVLPRKAAQVMPDTTVLETEAFPQVIGLDNQGAGTAQNDAYAMLAVSPNIPEGGLGQQSPTPDIRAVGVNTFPVPAGYCSEDSSFIWAFAVNTWERQSHLVPVSFLIDLDTDQDGIVDATILNRDASAGPPGFNQIGDGRQLAWALNYNTDSASAYFYAEHSTNTGNTVLYVCAEQVGLTGTDMLSTHVDVTVTAQDFYYGGPGDVVDGITVTPLGERWYGVPDDVPGFMYDPAGLTVYDFGPWPDDTPELGLMLVTNGDRGAGVRGGATQDTEALLFFGQ